MALLPTLLLNVNEIDAQLMNKVYSDSASFQILSNSVKGSSHTLFAELAWNDSTASL